VVRRSPELSKLKGKGSELTLLQNIKKNAHHALETEGSAGDVTSCLDLWNATGRDSPCLPADGSEAGRATASPSSPRRALHALSDAEGLTLVHFSAQLERFVWNRGSA